MAKAKPISTLNFPEKRGRKSWLIPLIKDLKVRTAIPIGRKLSDQQLKTTRSNLSIYGKRHEKKFAIKADDKGDLYVMRIA